MEYEERNLVVGLEIFLLVSMSFSFSYLIYEYHKSGGVTFNVNESETKFVSNARKIILDFIGGNLASAQEGLWTCPVNTNGSYCQEYTASQCNDNCQVDCLPSRADDTASCKTGTCIYDNGLSCSPNTPRLRCDDSEQGIGGIWDERDPGEIPQCQRGCCLLGSNAQFVTEAQCATSATAIGSSLDGTQNKFDADITSELECLALANPLAEGACVYSEEVLPGKYDCDFVNKQDCLNSGGDFHQGLLCSNSDLNTVCEKQSTTSCIVGKAEVYWVDSCGNKENIYEGGSGAARDRSWNQGKVLSKEDSCILGDSNNPIENQKSCGNCNYLAGSVCGAPGENDKKPSEGDFVCKDLSCHFVDEFGKSQTKKQGESWCVFDTKIGTEGSGNDERGVDVPGSSHYRQVCLDGEVRTESCLSGRREVCVQENDNDVGFSSASCRLNQWARCYEINQHPEELSKCEDITDCVLKTVDLTNGGDDNFKFSLCVPKYPPGFELKPNVDALGSISGQVQSDGEIACSLASVQCKKVVIKKGLFGGKKRINDKCDSPEFTEAMNNLCMSLGDCGGSVNVVGEYTDEGYNVVNAPKLSSNYISVLRKLIEPSRNQAGEPLSQNEINSLYGVNTGADDYSPDTSNLELIGGITGAAGSLLAYGANAGWLGSLTVTSGGLNLASGFEGTGIASHTIGGTVGPGLGAYASAAAGALIGASIVSLLLKFSGVGAGLSQEVQYALIVGGAIAGGIIGWGIANSSFGVLFGFGAGLGVLVIAIIVIGWLLGWGKKRVTTVSFDCKPWQAPSGGASCDKCGADGLPCDEYKCASLGQNCELINKGTNEEKCVNVSPDDSSAPVRSPDEDPLLEGFTYADDSTNGFRVVGPTSDGCLPVYTPVNFGIELSEPGQCKFSLEPGVDFSQMESYFGNSNLYRVNHAMTVNMPNLAALQGEGFDPNTRAEFNLYVKCRDRSGNENSADYAINFCVAPEDDLTAPILSRFAPASGSYVAFGAENEVVDFFVNEPAECRWDSQDVDYEAMQNPVGCVEDVESITPYGFACEADLPVTEDDNRYYFRCKDQPWLEDSNPDGLVRNTNSESTVYELKRSLSELKIDEIRPKDQTIYGGNAQFVNVNLVVKTSGGADGVQTKCYYDFGNNGNYVEFFDTGGDTHAQPLNLYFDSYDIGIKCEDEAGNIARGSTQFNVELDDQGPAITGFYNLNGILHVRTNEESECAYSFDNCGFNFEDGFGMSGFEFDHTTSFDTGLIYHIKCQDSYDNPSSCISLSGGLF